MAVAVTKFLHRERKYNTFIDMDDMKYIMAYIYVHIDEQGCCEVGEKKEKFLFI